MLTKTSAEAQNHFGQLLDLAQREPVAITRHGRIVAYVISTHEMNELIALKKSSNSAPKWLIELSKASQKGTSQT